MCRVTVASVWRTSVSVLTVALQNFLLALLRHSTHYALLSSLWFIFGFQSTRPLMPLSSNLTVHKQIFVATEMAASTLIGYSFTWKFYLTWTLSECELWDAAECGLVFLHFIFFTVKKKQKKQNSRSCCFQLVCLLWLSWKDAEMFALVGLRLKWV